MANSREEIVAKLELISAKAKLLALSFKNGKLWENELEKNINELKSVINSIKVERDDY